VKCDEEQIEAAKNPLMSAVTTVPDGKAEQIDHIFEGLVRVGSQLAWAADGIRDGIVLTCVLKKHSKDAHEYCLEAGILVAEGWLRMVLVQGEIKGFVRAYPKTAPPVLKEKILQFPMRSCGSKSGQVASGGRKARKEREAS
jgi:hypothetical protein